MSLIEYLMMHEEEIINLHFPAKIIRARCNELLMEGEYYSMYKIINVYRENDEVDVYVK